jgi:hypothetical protein
MTHRPTPAFRSCGTGLLAVVEEQGQALIRAAFSPIVRECGDISAGIFDFQGRMLAQAVTGTPGISTPWPRRSRPCGRVSRAQT